MSNFIIINIETKEVNFANEIEEAMEYTKDSENYYVDGILPGESDEKAKKEALAKIAAIESGQNNE